MTDTNKSDKTDSKIMNKKWKGYFRCDDLVPPLCDHDLVVTTGRVETLPGLYIKYWSYTPSVTHSHKFPIVIINGGPGLPHNFVRPTRNLACDGRVVVMYDQAGTGASRTKSKHNDNNVHDTMASDYPELLTLHYYAVVELPALLKHLQWPNYHILAESWGTQIALQFAIQQQDDNKYDNSHHGTTTTTTTIPTRRGLQSLILNAPIADNHKFIEYQWDATDGSVGQMPTYLQQQLLKFNQSGDFANDEFQELQASVLSTFNARIGVEVDCWIETQVAGISSMDYTSLTGPSDLFVPPRHTDLHGWTVLPELHRLRHIPVQLNHGGYDLVRPRLIADTVQSIIGDDNVSSKPYLVECHLLARAAHSILLDSPEEVYPYMTSFLYNVENAALSNNVLFRANGTCPTWNNKHTDNDNNRGEPWRVSSKGGTSLEMAGLLLIVAFCCFWLGLTIGTRRNKGYVGGYQQVRHDTPFQNKTHNHPLSSNK